MNTVYIILSVYNWEKYFLEQLMTIYHQNYTNWYLIIVDDWSTDSSYKIAENFIKYYNLNNKVRIIKQENQWTCKAIEKWLIEVKKINKWDNLIALCDADDIWTRDKLEIQVKYMNEHKECDLSFHDLIVIDENNKLKNTSFIYSELKTNPYNNSFFDLAVQNHITTTEMMFWTKDINDIIPIENEWAKDYWIALIFAINKKNISYIDKKLWFYRTWHQSIQKNLNSKWALKHTERNLLLFEKLKEKYPNNTRIDYFVSYISNKIKRLKKWYSRIHCLLLLFFYHTKIFFYLIIELIKWHIK